MGNFHNLEFVYCSRKQAKAVCERHHYMSTYPQGAVVNVALVDGGQVVGIAVFGYSSATPQKVARLCYGLERSQFIEMQRLWISDAYGHNTESYSLARIIKKLAADYQLQLIVTHAGGCKDDCGIVYQASGWLYFGATRCDDFYLTAGGQYRNMVAAMRFGRVVAKGKTKQQVGEELFGAGQAVRAHRYLYAYPIHKGIRRRLLKEVLPFPKQSAAFRRNQKWVTDGGAAGAGSASSAGSIPATSTTNHVGGKRG